MINAEISTNPSGARQNTSEIRATIATAGVIGKTADGYWFGRFAGTDSLPYPTFAMAKSWVLGMKDAHKVAA